MLRERPGTVEARQEEGAGGRAQKLRCLGNVHSGIQADTEHGRGVSLSSVFLLTILGQLN